MLFQIYLSIKSTGKLYVNLHVCVLCTTAHSIPFSVDCQYSAFFWLFDLCFFYLIMIKQIKKCLNVLLSYQKNVWVERAVFVLIHWNNINLQSIVSYSTNKINHNIHIFSLFNEQSLYCEYFEDISV